MNQELLYRYIKGETTPDEQRRILDWLDADPEAHSKELNAIRYLFYALDGFDASKADMLEARVIPLRRIATYVAGIAAALLLVIGANFLGRKTTLNDISTRMAAMEVPAGQLIKMTLEDGSQVWLNAGTKLEYPAVFGPGERRVRLSGEAMFDVQHEQGRPFIVETFASEVEVLGTKFNVLADEATRKFSASLLRGSICVTNLYNRETLYMMPNEVVSLVNGHLVKDRIEDPVALQWTDGILSIKGQTFLELMQKFERAYGVKIIIERKMLPNIEIRSGKIRVSDGVDHALRVLQLAADFDYTRNQETNEIIIQ